MRQAIDLEGLDGAVFTAGVHGDAAGWLNVQGVIAHCLKALRDGGKNSFAGVVNGGHEAVAWFGRTAYAGTGEQGQALVPQADAEQRDSRCGGRLDNVPGHAKVTFFLRGSWARGDNHVAELAGAHTLWNTSGLACGNDEGLGSGDLCDEVSEVISI